MPSLVALVLAAALLVLFVLTARAAPRRWLTGVLLTGALWAATTATAAPSAGARSLLLLPLVGAAVLGLLFVGNGLRLLGPAGRSRTNAVALVLGLAILAASALAVGVLPAGTSRSAVVAVVVLLLPGYPGLVLVSYALFCLAYLRRRARVAPAAIVVLGSGLVNGTVPTLLANRLDAAADAWRDEQALGHDPIVVPSGGQGDDEPMPEGVAMTAYLVAHGVPPDVLATEDRSTTTEENLLLSREILRARGLDGAGHLRVVTSGYHVGRAALLTRRLQLDADVTGAPTAWHFLPSAFLREFLAALTLHPRVNLAGLGVWVAGTAFLAYAVSPR
ncbi:hypothetical protein GCM10009868_34130 [Terrabacter aerolatus]|uniref:DUF218 domain-containing protein n=1 Tax=Terrabacter aerolatus TaxID=422442 RepID=A0A512CWL5_9MICO|nr:YdcF family protein [Terrabacter aerolatus]GEO28602.1 hypothetical protein TAE01_04120 [Terrabacter aerolatus]